jgi:hypothetical protein
MSPPLLISATIRSALYGGSKFALAGV